MFRKIKNLLLITLVIDLLILIKLGNWIGFLDVIILVISTSILGVYWAKLEGMKVISNLNSNLQVGSMPTDKIIDSVLIFAGGILLLIPGILTDLIALCLIISFTRKLFRKYVKSQIKSTIETKVQKSSVKIDNVIDV